MIGANTALSAAKGLLGARLDPYPNFAFLVEIDGLLAGGFSEITGLEIEIEVEEFREGGVNQYVHRIPSRARYPNLVLKRGLTDLDTLWWWQQDVVTGLDAGVLAESTPQRRNGTLFLLDGQRLPAMWWNFRDAYPVKWSGPQLQANGNQVAFESVELAHHGLSRPISARARGLARATSALVG